jgi:hypothetical protein
VRQTVLATPPGPPPAQCLPGYRLGAGGRAGIAALPVQIAQDSHTRVFGDPAEALQGGAATGPVIQPVASFSIAVP